MQTNISKHGDQKGFTLVEIILVLVIMSIIITMVTNPGLLRQRDSVTATQASNNLLSFMDQRKMDMFLGKKLGNMLVQNIQIQINTLTPETFLQATYGLEPSRTQDAFERLLPEDTNLTYFLHYEEFQCDISEQGAQSFGLACAYPERLQDFLTTEIIACDVDGDMVSTPESIQVLLQKNEILFDNNPAIVKLKIKTTYKGLFSQMIHWDKRTGVMYNEYTVTSENLTCS